MVAVQTTNPWNQRYHQPPECHGGRTLSANTGPSGPGTGRERPARADHHAAGLGVPSAQHLGCGRRSASEQCAAEGEVSVVGTVVADRGEPSCGQGDPCQVREGAELEASWPITAGDVAGRAGHGPGRASVPITAGARRPCRSRPGTRCAVCRRAGPRIPAQREKKRGSCGVLRCGSERTGGAGVECTG